MVGRTTFDLRKSKMRRRIQARRMRREAIDAERRFWYFAQNRFLGGYKFRRQAPIGPYIADFLCVEKKLVIEIDGSQHLESAHDKRRDTYLIARGFRVLRFWNSDVLQNMESVGELVLAVLREK